MKRYLSLLVFSCLLHPNAFSQDFGNFPKIEKDKLLNDLELLYQGLDKFHSGMYWYSSKDTVDFEFQKVRDEINDDLNVLEFHKRIARLVALSREDHTDIFLPDNMREQIKAEARYLPLSIVFLGDELYCLQNGSNFEEYTLVGKRIESINGETPQEIVNKIGNLFASDGFIQTVKYSDLRGLRFAKYYFYYYGIVEQYEIKFKEFDWPIVIEPLSINEITNQLKRRYANEEQVLVQDPLEYEILSDSIAYLGVHTFSNSDIKEESREKDFKTFLQNSFTSIAENEISTLIIDVSQNGGGTEGNEGLLYAYIGDNYKKYEKVRAKTQKAVLDNGVDKAIKLKTFGFFEKVFANKKQEDGSLERKAKSGNGLMAYKKEPEYKFTGKTYVIISPITYSGSSEFSNMVYTNNLATFVGQETGGGYLGNTSGYSESLVLPNSKIEIDIPALQFVMNVEPQEPFGRGVIPHYEVIPTFKEYRNGENASLRFILEVLEKKF